MQRQSPRFKVRVQWITDRSYFVILTSGIRVKMELTKTNLLRVKAVYFGLPTFTKCQSVCETIAGFIKARFDIRDPKYTVGGHEVRVTGIRVPEMATIEQFLAELIASIRLAAVPTKVIELHPARPTSYRMQGAAMYRRGNVAAGID